MFFDIEDLLYIFKIYNFFTENLYLKPVRRNDNVWKELFSDRQ